MAIMKYYDEATSTWIELDAANGDTVDGLHFRINGGRLQYSSDGSIWSNAGTDTSDATAIASDILAGKTVYVNDVKITGTMVDRAGDTAASSLARSGTTIRLRATQGYRDGTNDYVTHTDANDVAGNIKSGVTIRGLAGACVEATGNAVVGDVLSGKTFSKAGSAGLTGTIPSKSAATYTPSQSTQTIAAGQYLSGAQTISAVSFDATKVLTGTTIAGKAGTMPNNGSQAATLNITGSTKPIKSIPAGYTTGGTVTAQIDASQAGNIKQNVNLAGCVGTLVPLTTEKRWASGTAQSAGYRGMKNVITNENDNRPYVTVSGLAFNPTCVFMHNGAGKYTLAYSTSKICFIVNDSSTFSSIPLGIAAYRTDADENHMSMGFSLPILQGTTLSWIAVE